jgi:thioredoxin reductase (NADPH)
MSDFDILVIGGGPIGLACGIEAEKAGLSYVIIEKGTLVNSLYNYPVNMTFFSTAERLEIGNVPFMTLHPKPKRPEAIEYYRRVTEQYKLNIRLFELVQAMQKLPGDEGFAVQTSRSHYSAKNVIVATGFYDIPSLMNVPGEDLAKVFHYYKDPAFFAFQKVLVVGGSNSAVDAALECWRKGAEVTVVHRQAEIGPRVKYWVRPDIINRIEEGSIKAFFNASISAIRPEEVDIQTLDGIITIPNDFVIAMTGYQPNFDFLQQLGIELAEDETLRPLHNTDTMQTNVPGLYLAGVVCGGMETHKWFIENSREHALKIIADIKAKKVKTID